MTTDNPLYPIRPTVTTDPSMMCKAVTDQGQCAYEIHRDHPLCRLHLLMSVTGSRRPNGTFPVIGKSQLRIFGQ